MIPKCKTCKWFDLQPAPNGEYRAIVHCEAKRFKDQVLDGDAHLTSFLNKVQYKCNEYNQKGNSTMSNCKCNEELTAVSNKVTRMVADAFDAMDEQVSGISSVTDAGASEITKKLFNNMTKGDIVAGILDGDTLSFKNLMAREDVQVALKATETLHVKTFEDAFAFGEKMLKGEAEIRNLADLIIEDTIIFGITDDVRNNIVTLEGVIESVLNNI